MTRQMNSTRLRRALAAAALACAAALGGAPATAATPAAVEFDPEAPPAQWLEVSDAKALKGVRQVAIAAFNVEFVTATSASAQARDIGRTGTTGMNVYWRLTELDGADMQAITDALHDRLVADLSRAGIEVLPPERLRATAAWRKLAASGAASPMAREMQRTQSQVVSAHGAPIWGFSAQRSSGPLGALAAFGQAIEGISGTVELLGEMQVPLLSVEMRVDFANMETNTGSLLGRISGTAEVRSKLALTLTKAQFTVQAPQAGGAVSLARPLILPGEAFAGTRDVSSVAGNVALAMLSLAIGNGGSQTVKEMEVRVDAPRYRELLVRHLGGVGAMMVERWAAQWR